MKHIKSSLLFGSGFAGGLVAGWLLSSYQNADILQAQKEKAEMAIARINSAVKEGTERLRDINDRVKREISDPIPDLYRATESLTLDEDELFE